MRAPSDLQREVRAASVSCLWRVCCSVRVSMVCTALPVHWDWLVLVQHMLHLWLFWLWLNEGDEECVLEQLKPAGRYEGSRFCFGYELLITITIPENQNQQRRPRENFVIIFVHRKISSKYTLPGINSKQRSPSPSLKEKYCQKWQSKCHFLK